MPPGLRCAGGSTAGPMPEDRRQVAEARAILREHIILAVRLPPRDYARSRVDQMIRAENRRNPHEAKPTTATENGARP